MRLSLTDEEPKVYLVGGGIASLAAATFLIRDAGISGRNITIFEESTQLGGHLGRSDSVDADAGYVMRASLMFESKYLCTYDLFSSIPSLNQRRTVTQEIFEQNAAARKGFHPRIIVNGQRVDQPKFGLTERQIRRIERIGLESEAALGRTSIEHHFDQQFFESGFWMLWSSTFSFRPWHSAAEFRRYLLRFMNILPSYQELQGVIRTVFDQESSIVKPLVRWLSKHSVKFATNTKVVDIGFCHSDSGYTVDTIYLESGEERRLIPVRVKDNVFVTLGSITDSTRCGAMDEASVPTLWAHGSAWHLWRRIAGGKPYFGRPELFTSHVDLSMGVSFTATLRDPFFLRAVGELAGKRPQVGGMVTLASSNWLTSIVLPAQPHFAKQPVGVEVLWGRGVCVERPGNFVTKPMTVCTGREIMREILGHLKLGSRGLKVLDTCTCIPCFMPFITSQFLCRGPHDRPQVIPEGSKNMAFMGQFCEVPDDVVFTMEYSIRSAQAAVYSLLKLRRVPPPVYKGRDDQRITSNAMRALH